MLKESLMDIIRKYTMLVAFILFLIIYFFVSGWKAASLTNILSIVLRTCVVTILGIGQSLVIIGGGIDLSIGAQIDHAIGLMTILYPFKDLLGGFTGIVVITLIITTTFGFINGLIIYKTKLPPFIVTFAMMLILESLATLYSYYGVMGIWGFKPWLISLFSFLPSPTVSVPILFTFLILLAASIIARRTIYGYSIYAIGSSYKAATASGVPIGKVTLITYSLSGFMGGLAWFMYSLQVGYIFAYTAGTIYLLDSIAVPVIGGIDIMGGTGYVPMLFIGALFVSTISNFIILMKINPLLEYAVKGIIIIVALIFSRLLKK